MSTVRKGSIYMLLLGALLLVGYAAVTTAQERDLSGVAQQRVQPVASIEPAQGDPAATNVCQNTAAQSTEEAPTGHDLCNNCNKDNDCKHHCCPDPGLARCTMLGTCMCGNP